MKFTEFTISTTTEAQELVADIMWQYTSYGVAISDVKDVVELINDRKSTWDYLSDEVLKELNSKERKIILLCPYTHGTSMVF